MKRTMNRVRQTREDKKMRTKHIVVLVLLMVVAGTVPVRAEDSDKTEVISASDLQWKDMGIPGVVAAQVSGDMATGPSRFFLTYPVGLVTPNHHHSTDHYVAVVSGTITLTIDGEEHMLGPGSYFALTGKKPHIAKVEGDENAVMFIQADGPWDVVMEE